MVKMLAKARKKNPDKGALDYGRSVRASMRGLWRGETDTFAFVDDMVGAIQRNFTRAYYDGAAECGISPQDLTPQELAELSTQINTEISYLVNLANNITANSRANKGAWGQFAKRAEMWQNAYERVRNTARASACGDQKLMWQMGAHCKEHCKDCRRLDGRVYRASTWNASGWIPRSAKLECGGYRCCCEFMITNLPVSSGSP
jgi:hypothetical protein